VKRRTSTALLMMACAMGCGVPVQQGPPVNAGSPQVIVPTPARCPGWPPGLVASVPVQAPGSAYSRTPGQTPDIYACSTNAPFITSIAVGQGTASTATGEVTFPVEMRGRTCAPGPLGLESIAVSAERANTVVPPPSTPDPLDGNFRRNFSATTGACAAGSSFQFQVVDQGSTPTQPSRETDVTFSDFSCLGVPSAQEPGASCRVYPPFVTSIAMGERVLKQGFPVEIKGRACPNQDVLFGQDGPEGSLAPCSVPTGSDGSFDVQSFYPGPCQNEVPTNVPIVVTFTVSDSPGFATGAPETYIRFTDISCFGAGH
jgi:hypothetical protein